MPIQIDQVDSEVEILPSTGGDRPAAAAAAASLPAAAPGADVRRMIVRTLEDELDAYLRTRG